MKNLDDTTTEADAEIEFASWSDETGSELSVEFASCSDTGLAGDHSSSNDEHANPADEPLDLELYTPSADVPVVASHRKRWTGAVASTVFHIWLLATLGVATYIEPPLDADPPPFTVVQTTEEEEEVIEEDVAYELADPKDRDLEVKKVIRAASFGLVQSEEPKPLDPPKPLSEQFTDELDRPPFDLPEGIEVSDQIQVTGSTGEGLIEIESALDRITWEVANHLQEERVLLIWLMDGSGSLIRQRELIASRLNRVYGELDALNEAGQIPRREEPLLTSVVSYGQGVNFLTPAPTPDFQEVLDNVTNIPLDSSGQENVFDAVYKVLGHYEKSHLTQNRRILLAVVTDESGDDFAMLEPAISRCRRMGAHAYVIGPAATFGRRQGYVNYVAPEDGETYQLAVDLGPETPMVSRLNLKFWHNGPKLEYLSSGFGPYGLSRLVEETGGVYFMSNMTTMETLTPVGMYDGENLQPFKPDYSHATPEEYLTDIGQFPIRKAVWLATKKSNELDLPGQPRMRFRIEPGDFRTQFNDAQKSMAIGVSMLDRVGVYFPADAEALYAEEPSLRWRMSFDLAYGRLLASKVRMLEYNMACAEMEASLTDQEVEAQANEILFEPSLELNFATNARRWEQTAREHLSRVIKEAPGTPWAMLAARELAHPMGLKVVKNYIPPPTVLPGEDGPAGPNRPRVRLAPDERPQPRPTQPMPPKPKPKLPRL